MLIKGDRREQTNPLQFYLDRDISVPGAEKIISLIVSAKISSVEALAGEAKIHYRVAYKVIFKGSSGIDCKEESYDHGTLIKSNAITPKSHLDLAAQVIANEYVGTENLKIRSTIEIKGYVIVSAGYEMPAIPDGIYTKTAPVIVECIEPIRESEIIASADFDLKEEIDRILTYDTQIIVKKVSTATEICRIEGECYTYITYLTGGSLSSKCLMTPFDNEILAPAVKDGSEAYCSGIPQSTTITLTGGGGMKTEIVVAVKGFCVAKQDADVLEDAYSKHKELNIDYGSMLIEKNVCLTGAQEKLSGSVRLPEDAARLRSVLCVCPPSIGAINVSNNAGLTVEGIVTVSVVYLDDDENINETLAELPYHFMLSRDFSCESGLFARAMVTSVTARARHNDEIEISGELYIEIYGSEGKEVKYINKIEELGDKEQNDCAISLYIVEKGETMWDVAKALLSDEDTLLGLNPDLALPLKGGEKVLMYREL